MEENESMEDKFSENAKGKFYSEKGAHTSTRGERAIANRRQKKKKKNPTRPPKKKDE